MLLLLLLYLGLMVVIIVMMILLVDLRLSDWRDVVVDDGDAGQSGLAVVGVPSGKDRRRKSVIGNR